MKFLIVIACSILVASVQSMTLAEQKQMMIGLAQECKITEDASDDDLGNLVKGKPMNSKEGKCLMACIMENMDMMADGKLSKEGVVDFAKAATGGDAAKMKGAMEILAECGSISDPDRCELAFKAGGCIKMGGMKKNIDFGI